MLGLNLYRFIFIESVKAETFVEDEKDDITDDTEQLMVTDFVMCEISVCPKTNWKCLLRI